MVNDALCTCCKLRVGDLHRWDIISSADISDQSGRIFEQGRAVGVIPFGGGLRCPPGLLNLDPVLVGSRRSPGHIFLRHALHDGIVVDVVVG